MLTTLQRTLEGNPRFSQANPCYHSGGTVFFLDEQGKLQQEGDTSWAAQPNPFNISHNVAPTAMALGAGGCNDCHSDKAWIFRGWPANGTGVDRRQRENDAFAAVSLIETTREYSLKILHKYNSSKNYLIPLFFTGIFTMVMFRQRPSDPKILLHPNAGVPLGHTTIAWLILVRNLMFLLLAGTGIGFFFIRIGLVELFFVTQHSAAVLHWCAGGVFVITILSCIIMSIRSSLDKSDDSYELGIFGGRMLIVVITATGVGMLFREQTVVDLKYILSLPHTYTAFTLMAVFAAKSYHISIRRISTVTPNEIHRPAADREKQGRP